MHLLYLPANLLQNYNIKIKSKKVGQTRKVGLTTKPPFHTMQQFIQSATQGHFVATHQMS